MRTRQAFDTELLASIFFPGQPNKVYLLTGKTPPADALAFFAFGKKRELPGFQRLSFGFINNPDGSIRWLYPRGSGQAHFLQLYNGSGWRGWLFKSLFGAAFRLRLEGLVRSGTLHVFYKEKAPLNGLLGLCPSGKLAIFTGTVGENRKAVMALEDQAGQHWFYKQPLTPAAAKLVENEQLVLTNLAQLKLEKMAVPTAKQFGAGLLVSDVKPAAGQNSFDLQSAHFEALASLAEQTGESSQLGSLPFWKGINEDLIALQNQPILNDLLPDTVRHVIDQLLQLQAEFSAGQLVPTSLAHGDFTPWNMYLGNDCLHVYDWELSERLPLLFDAFHFVFQSSILVKKLAYGDIQPAVFSLKNKEEVRRILAGAHANFEELYRLYLLRNTSYYLLKYIRQQPLHQQAHWLLNAWNEALKAVNSSSRILNNF